MRGRDVADSGTNLSECDCSKFVQNSVKFCFEFCKEMSLLSKQKIISDSLKYFALHKPYSSHQQPRRQEQKINSKPKLCISEIYEQLTTLRNFLSKFKNVENQNTQECKCANNFSKDLSAI